jgi:ribosomal protein S18 acetylase RimI-like enzyme
MRLGSVLILLACPGTAPLCLTTHPGTNQKLVHPNEPNQQPAVGAPGGDKTAEVGGKPAPAENRNASAGNEGAGTKLTSDSVSAEDRIALWTMLAAVVTALATGAQVGVTYLIARSIAKASGVSEALQISREIDRIWQDFNRQAIINEDFRNTIRTLESLSETAETTQLRHLIFYLLNIIYISWTAQREQRDTFEHSRTIVKDHLRILYTKKELVLAILNGHRGYNKIFVEDCVEAFAQMDRECADLERERRSVNDDLVGQVKPSAGATHSQADVILHAASQEDSMSEPTQNAGLPADGEGQDTPVVQRQSDASGAPASSLTEVKQLVVTRFARPDEWQKIQALNLQIFEFELEHCEPTSHLAYPFSPEGEAYFKQAAQQDDNLVAFVAEVGNEVVGYAIVKKIPAEDLTHRVGVVQYQLHTLSVDRTYRDKGIGGELIDAAKAYAKQRGANRMKVIAYQGNDRAEYLYKKKGFAELEITYEAKL